MNILLLFGVTLFITILTSFLFIRLRLPQVIGYILAGIVLGISGFQLFDAHDVQSLTMVTYFALGMIGFTIGGELRWARIKRFGASILIITFFESSFSCLAVFFAVYLLTFNLPLALLLGGLACATAPGGTTNVIQEYKARGQLTSTLYGVVGADDAFAIIIFAFLSGISKVLIGASESINALSMLAHIISDIGGAFLLGLILGGIVSTWMLYVRSSDVRHLITLTSILICTGLSVAFNVSLILSTMVMGIVVGNIRPHRSRSCFVSLHAISTPLYMLFFVLIGARLDYKLLLTMGSVGMIYFIFRLFGKYFGAFTGSYIANVPDKVRKNIGLCLFSQAGVAIGLALSTDIEFSKYNLEAQQLGASIVTIVTASTLIFQIIGPIMTKYALFKAKETHV
ncbi:potassium transporter [Candidatus Marinamargulisbacteria bacterium SCGC AG-343-K17]|nr:potassium transporter [Candidatus Marinamargulisbacteria bacterium SCGC AG-343-K17]